MLLFSQAAGAEQPLPPWRPSMQAFSPFTLSLYIYTEAHVGAIWKADIGKGRRGGAYAG